MYVIWYKLLRIGGKIYVKMNVNGGRLWCIGYDYDVVKLDFFF